MVQQLNRLTTLERARDWVGATTSQDDLLLTRLIDSCSRFVLSYLSRVTLFQHTFGDIYDGKNNTQLILRNYPVLSVASVLVNNVSVPQWTIPPVASQQSLYGAGWVLEPWDGFPPGRPQALSVRGYMFYQGVSNIAVTYTSGYVIQNEAQVVPGSPGPYNLPVSAPSGSWGADQGVTYASSGSALTPVTYGPSVALSTGQYMAANGIYYFAAGDAGASLLISYSYVPADVEHAVMEMVGERYNYRTRIGQVSKSLGGQETMSFSQKNMSDFVKTQLQPYKRVVPL